MKYVKIIVGVIASLALIMGSIWILQGVNILPGSFMTGDIHWSYRGAVLAVIGLALLVIGLRKPRTPA